MTFRFDGFRLDTENGRLENDAGPIPLNLKAFNVLRVLVERRGQLVLKDQLLDEVWPDTHVADGVLKVRMGEIRQALGDSARQPRFIETVHRRGYRFIADVTVTGAEAWPSARSSGAASSSAGLVGRGRDLALLEERLARTAVVSISLGTGDVTPDPRTLRLPGPPPARGFATAGKAARRWRLASR